MNDMFATAKIFEAIVFSSCIQIIPRFCSMRGQGVIVKPKYESRAMDKPFIQDFLVALDSGHFAVRTCARGLITP